MRNPLNVFRSYVLLFTASSPPRNILAPCYMILVKIAVELDINDDSFLTLALYIIEIVSSSPRVDCQQECLKLSI